MAECLYVDGLNGVIYMGVPSYNDRALSSMKDNGKPPLSEWLV